MRHVKPHGALYNLASRDRAVADAVVAGVIRTDASLALYAPHGSALAAAGRGSGDFASCPRAFSIGPTRTTVR